MPEHILSKIIHSEVSDTNGHFVVLDKVAVSLVSGYVVLIFPGLFLVPLIITMFCVAKTMLAILAFTTFDLNECAFFVLFFFKFIY